MNVKKKYDEVIHRLLSEEVCDEEWAARALRDEMNRGGRSDRTIATTSIAYLMIQTSNTICHDFTAEYALMHLSLFRVAVLLWDCAATQ